MAKSRTQEYYDKNPEARAKKNAYQKEYNKKPSAKKKRAEDNAARKMLGLKKGDPRDASRRIRIDKYGRLVVSWTKEHKSSNRGSKSNTAGDKRARGKKNK